MVNFSSPDLERATPMRGRQFFLLLGAGLLFCECLTYPTKLAAGNDVKSSERLRLLQTATGQPAAATSYEAQLDAILSTTTDPARTSVANQDAQDAALVAVAPVEKSLANVNPSIPPASIAEEQKRENEAKKEK